MYQINKPEEGCVVFATKNHPKLMNGARVGVCEKILKGALLVSDGDKEYVICTIYKGPRFHDYWLEGKNPKKTLPRTVRNIIKNDFLRKTSEFAAAYNVAAESAHHWQRSNWILYDGELYSPKHRHERWVKEQDINVPLITFDDLIFSNYCGDPNQFVKKNGHSFTIVQSWIKGGWIIFKGMMYSPQRLISK